MTPQAKPHRNLGLFTFLTMKLPVSICRSSCRCACMHIMSSTHLNELNEFCYAGNIQRRWLLHGEDLGRNKSSSSPMLSQHLVAPLRGQEDPLVLSFRVSDTRKEPQNIWSSSDPKNKGQCCHLVSGVAAGLWLQSALATGERTDCPGKSLQDEYQIFLYNIVPH